MLRMVVEKRGHHRLSASGAKRWMACPGSLRINAGLESVSSEYAMEGTAAHELAETCIRYACSAESLIDSIVEVEGKEFVVSDDMANAVQVYLDVIEKTAPAEKVAKGLIRIYLEESFQLSYIHEDMGGSVDFLAYNTETKDLVVADYKHGKGILVSPYENPQLMIYALGAVDTLGIRDEVNKIFISIVQPRAGDGEPQIWETTMERLSEFEEELRQAVAAVDLPDAPLNPGDHCKFCLSEGTCEAKREKMYDVACSEFSAYVSPPAPESLTNEQISKVLKASSEIASWAKAVEAHAQTLLENGHDIEGYKLVTVTKHKAWLDGVEEELVGKLGEDNAYVKKLVSPAQAEKILGSKRKAEIAHLWVKPDGGVAIAPESDRRKAIASTAEADFAPITMLG